MSIDGRFINLCGLVREPPHLSIELTAHWPSIATDTTMTIRMMKGLIMKPQLYPAQRRHLERYAQGGVEGFKNTRSEHKLLELGFIERCDEIVWYTETVPWTIYKARITPVGRAYLTSG